MLEVEEYKTVYEPGFHVVQGLNGDYVPACYLETKVRIPKMGYCKTCKKELGRAEVGSLCFSCRDINWGEASHLGDNE